MINDIFWRLSNMFWEDYVAEAGPAGVTGSHVRILTDFLVWIERRKARSPIIDLRLIKDPSAGAAADYIMGVVNGKEQT